MLNVNLKIFVGIAFLWPIKKNSPQKVETRTKKSPSFLEKADDLFENGHYNECFLFLTTYKTTLVGSTLFDLTALGE